MRFTTIASALLLAGNALAAPGTALRRERELQRRASGRKGNPMLKVDGPEGLSTNNTNVEYSSNWAGAVLIGTGYTSVTGTFTIPTPTSAGSGSVSPLSSLVPSQLHYSKMRFYYCFTNFIQAWVGIDGDTCGTAILQTGIDWTKSGSSITYDAWYEWYPDYAYDFSGISLSAGDSITVTVTAKSM